MKNKKVLDDVNDDFCLCRVTFLKKTFPSLYVLMINTELLRRRRKVYSYHNVSPTLHDILHEKCRRIDKNCSREPLHSTAIFDVIAEERF